MNSKSVHSLLDNAITNYSIDDEIDHHRYERCAEAIGTRAFIAAVKDLDERPAESLSAYTRQELEEKYRWLSKQFRQAVVGAAEYQTLALALDIKMSQVAGLVEEAFTKYVPQPDSPALLFEVCGVSSKPRLDPSHTAEDGKTPYLRLIK